MINIGFPEESFLPDHYDVSGADPKLDMLIALLCVGLYPNVCFHKEKRKVLTTESKDALMHKTSVNFSKQDIKFPSPFFIFEEKVSYKEFMLLSISRNDREDSHKLFSEN